MTIRRAVAAIVVTAALGAAACTSASSTPTAAPASRTPAADGSAVAETATPAAAGVTAVATVVPAVSTLVVPAATARTGGLPGATATARTVVSPQSVTLADDGSVIHLRAGDRFLLNLGMDTYGWRVTVSDESVISRVVNITVIRGALGVYEAHAAGSATLTATGDPLCRSATPPCGAPSRVFRVEIVVS